MSDRANFTVPKDQQDVSVHLLGGVELKGSIFLEYTQAELTIHKKVIAFLEDTAAFFPLRLSETGSTEFINKASVRLVELVYSADGEKDNLALSLMQSVNVSILFTNGATLNGQLLADVPAEKARLSDCLNLPGRFLSIKVDGKISYINKNALQKVVYAGRT